jgi:type IV pilus assembly protein PilB
MEDLCKIIKPKYALKHMLVPIEGDGNTVRIAIQKKPIRELLNELRFIFNKNIKFEIWEEARILEEISVRYAVERAEDQLGDNSRYTFIEKKDEPANASMGIMVKDKYVITFVDQMISEAIHKRASDIHVELYERQIRIRFRIDGKLRIQTLPVYSKRKEIVSRLKIMAKMDIAEKRRPQDGRIRMRNGTNDDIDIRVSTLPNEFGEKIVLRILDKSSLNLSLESLGFDKQNLKRFKNVLRLPYGMILVTGPTGSGKTTTLYSALNFLNAPEVNIISIEDPIEYNLTGINQTQVRSDIGLTFASILRTVLRQDPNIIMVGEIRDSKTAEIAIRSAQTGHLVLSTLHTNDAITTISRLIDMGIEPFLITSSLKLVLAQRLIRKICPRCKTIDQINWKDIKIPQPTLEQSKMEFYKGAGCFYCNGSGYHGREAVIEQIEIDEEFSQLILQRANLNEIRDLVRKKGIESLYAAALKKALNGITSLTEVLSETINQ